MDWSVPSACLNSKRLFIPCPYSISGHVNSRKSAVHVLVIRNFQGFVSFVFSFAETDSGKSPIDSF